jgi:hypothetical protein
MANFDTFASNFTHKDNPKIVGAILLGVDSRGNLLIASKLPIKLISASQATSSIVKFLEILLLAKILSHPNETLFSDMAR